MAHSNTNDSPANDASAIGPQQKQTPLTRALDTIKTLRRRLDEQEGNQAVAIVGIGLRLPGGIEDLDGYWTALAEGQDLVRPLPEARKGPFAADWQGLPQRGGFLDDVLGFDAEFFGISPREARHLDPQHRLLLEVAWEALESAAIPARRLDTVTAGVYLGIMWQDYREWLESEPDAYATTGNGHNFAAGRIAHALGLRGPAVAVDTACSSSLVAVHLAAQALRRGECEVAFAAGANLIMSPRSMRLVQETRSLAPDGLCKTFDARANGFTRGEGCGAVVLKLLEHARRDGDRIHAVLHATAVNQDGRSGGFTAPNVLSQVSLIEAALAQAGLEPSDIGHVEAHGTGTALGDPIEMEALATTLGRRNNGSPLPVGSVKTNFGHLESAAGIAGLIKAVLTLRHRLIPPLVHFRTLNPRIDLSGTNITVPDELLAWPTEAGRFAAVSSFGMSGTNAHAVLGPPPVAEATPAEATAPVTGFDLSARTPEALRELAKRYADHLESPAAASDGYAAFAYTTTHGRSHHLVRARVTAGDITTACAALRALASGIPSDAVELTETAPGDSPSQEPAPAHGIPRRVAGLPSYPWQRRRHAPDAPAQAALPAPAVSPPTGESGPPRPVAHEVVWEALPAVGAPVERLVIAGDDHELLSLLMAQAECGTVLAPEPIAVPDGWQQAPLPTDADGWAAFFADLAGQSPCPLLLAPDSPSVTSADGRKDPVTDTASLCASVTAAVRGLARAGGPHRVHVLTRGTLRVVEGERTRHATGHGALHGLAPVLGLELGSSWGGIVDLPAVPTAADASALIGFIGEQTQAHAMGSGTPVEDAAAIRAGQVRAARLRTADRHRSALTVRADATYLVTGGLGAVGRELTQELVARGARHLLLIGRRPEQELPAEARSLLTRLRSLGAEVVYRSGGCDTREKLDAACTPLRDMPAVRGILHAAGTLERSPAAETTRQDFAVALSAKAAPAWLLHLASADWPLDFFVLVSSVSAQWGTEGCAAYSAANGALDALAASRVGSGLPATSLAYGPWALDGLGMADDDARARFARLGVGALSPEAGRAALTGHATSPSGHVVLCPLDPPRLARVMSGLRSRGLFADAAATGASGPADAPAAEEPKARSLADELASLTPKVREQTVLRHVRLLVAEQLGHADPGAVQDTIGFLDLGLDSIMAMELSVRLSQVFGLRFQVADVFNYPTVHELARFLLDEPAGQEEPVTQTASPLPAAAAPASAGADAGQEQSARSGARNQEPIAVVGMAGRFPGADSVDELWELLKAGRDGVGTVPSGRWDEAITRGAGPLTTDQGGFLRDLDRFDAAFFDIPAREAANLDPQQRLLLESAWHALEDAGIDPSGLRGSRTGVFVGLSYADYARLLAGGGADEVDAYYTTGTALNAAAGRIAFTLGLHGPAMAVDTACSSSLVALHLAVRSLRSGETDTVLAGGANILLDPLSSIAVSRAHMLSPRGRCRTFSADADGFVRSEGCGVLALKRLGDARRDGDRVLAVIRGSAVNQDGASSGLTAPNGHAQELMLATALADAGVAGHEVSYLEAHGTGTALGDPIELGAAWKVLGPGRRPEEPLLVGSAKSNVGHCESAAGVVGVIKTVLALRHGVIPANLHFDRPNPHVPWDDMNIRVADEAVPWQAGERPRLAGVSGFGFTGTNAHILLSDPPDSCPVPPAVPEPATAHLVPLSAPDAEGLERLTTAWEQRLSHASDDELPSLAAAATAGRAHFPYRRALLGSSRDQLMKALRGSTPDPAPSRPPQVAFLFSGQGSQYFGMGRELYENEPVFREVFDSCDQVVAPRLGASLAELTFYGSDHQAINETRVTQPALVALEVALAALWKSWGVTPAVVLGHSVGEISAALHAGVMDLSTGFELVLERARLMQGTDRGSMLAVVASEEAVRDWIDGTGLDVAAVNGPESVVVSGVPEAVHALAAGLRQQGVRTRPLSVSHAFHSRLLDPVLPDLAEALGSFTFREPTLPIVSNVTGRLADVRTYDAAYWCEHARNPVRFYDSARQLAPLGIDVCLEIGPDRTLINLVRAAGRGPAGGLAASLRRGGSDRESLLTAAKTLYEQGQDLDWNAVHPRGSAPRVGAPRYPFATSRHWTRARSTPSPDVPWTHGPAWGTELRSPALRGRVFVSERSTSHPPHLTDHRLFGTVSVPGASQTATTLSALGSGGVPIALADLHFPRALVLHEGERYELQTVSFEQEDGATTVSVQSLVDPQSNRWQEHLAARAVPAVPGPSRSVPDRDAFVATAERHLTGAAFYRHLRTLGYHLGPSFRWLAEAWIKGDEALVRFVEPEHMNEPSSAYEIHPGLLDSCLQSTVAFAVDQHGETAAAEASELAIPFAASRLDFPGRPPRGEDLWGHVQAVRNRRSGDFLQVESADLHLFRSDGSTVLAVDDFRFRLAPRALLERSLRRGTEHAYGISWKPLEPALASSGLRVVALLGAEGETGRTVKGALEDLGHQVFSGEPSGPLGADVIVDARFHLPDDAGDAESALAAALDLSASLRSVPGDVPYAVLSSATDSGAPLREALWGMLASLAAEQPGRRLLRVGLGEDWDAKALARTLVDGPREGVLEMTAESVRTAHLTPLQESAPPAAKAAGQAKERGSVLITGGLGGLGLSAAAFLARREVSSITLMSRSDPDDAARSALEELEASGTRVHVLRGDVTDPEDCRRAVDHAAQDAPLRTVLHLAGTTDDHAFEQLTPDSFRAVFEAKAHGADALVRALGEQPLDAFVLFSSAASVLGSAGQTNYAAANGFLDGLAHRLRRRGVPATSINWGPWLPRSGRGLAANDVVEGATAGLGIRPIADDEAEELLALALTGQRERLVAVAVDRSRYGAALSAQGRSSMFDGAVRQPAAKQEPARGWLRGELHALSAADGDARLRAALHTLTGEVLGSDSTDDDLGFGDMGLDSIMSIDLRTRLAHALGTDLPATVAFDHPTVAQLAAYAARGLYPASDQPPVRTEHTPPPPVVPDAPTDDGSLQSLSFDELLHTVQADVATEK
ncbi:type I polyketide synthase [Streptomyces sp. NPDC087300]|uniref:type I polyketide synthase n=1 Tax=Streptomyces sp. NPDC087300 TaxID=3365780 RepID=UPI0037F5EEEF